MKTLKSKLLHPEILKVLGCSGHGSQILIADGNYPFASRCGPNTTVVYLNLTPGIPTATDVLATLVDAIPIEGATVMQPPGQAEASILKEFREILPAGQEIKSLERYAFYEAASSAMTTLVIATAEVRRFANILLTVGVVKLTPDESI